MDQREVSERQERRRGLKAAYGVLFDEVAAILFRHDPEGINFESNTDEYELEAGTIIPRLDGCTSTEDVQRLVHEEFRKWFSPGVTQPFETFRQPAEDIWQAWTKFREKVVRPNPRPQRTPLRAPLSRKPFGDRNPQRGAQVGFPDADARANRSFSVLFLQQRRRRATARSRSAGEENGQILA